MQRQRPSKRRGFSLIELLAVTGILVAISSIILVNNAQFGGAITLKNLAYDMALSVREAQIYGISVRRYGASNFQPGYGMHFRASSPTSYILFVDADVENGRYDGGDELVESFTIGRGHTISDLCVTLAGAETETCGMDKLDILFKRPEPDAQIRYNDGDLVQQRARVEVLSPRGDTVDVIIESTGQISVE